MTDKVHTSFGRVFRSREASVVNKFAHTNWVQPSSGRLIEDSEGDLATGSLGGFAETSSTSSFDVTIDSGEALVRGAYIARDTTTTVTLASSTNNQTVYVGWQDGVSDTVIIGLDADFTADDPQHAIWEFDTDSSGVTSSTDLRYDGPQNETFTYSTFSDVPTELPKGTIVHVEDENTLYFEDGV